MLVRIIVIQQWLYGSNNNNRYTAGVLKYFECDLSSCECNLSHYLVYEYVFPNHLRDLMQILGSLQFLNYFLG